MKESKKKEKERKKDRRKEEMQRKDLREPVSTRSSEPFVPATLCQRANQRRGGRRGEEKCRRCLSLQLRHAAPRSEDAELHCSYDVDGGGGIYVPPPDAQESTGLNDERAASARLTIKS